MLTAVGYSQCSDSTDRFSVFPSRKFQMASHSRAVWYGRDVKLWRRSACSTKRSCNYCIMHIVISRDAVFRNNSTDAVIAHRYRTLHVMPFHHTLTFGVPFSVVQQPRCFSWNIDASESIPIYVRYMSGRARSVKWLVMSWPTGVWFPAGAGFPFPRCPYPSGDYSSGTYSFFLCVKGLTVKVTLLKLVPRVGMRSLTFTPCMRLHHI
jgi:hypothetical protein